MQAAPPSPNIIPDGTLLDEKFRILRCIGRGGMGAVYEIQHTITKHHRALKMLYPFVAADRDAVDRFLLEASAAGTIENPHIVETYDAGWLSSGEPYLVMELLQGESLEERLESAGRLPLKEALAVVAQAAHAVHAAHEAGIVHRDLKPENIFLTVSDELEVFVKVLDFGISKFEHGLAGTRATKAGAFMGTPQYMSPEQFLDSKGVDRRADVYSLGILLFECITGEHPYPCDTLAELARKIMVEEVPPPSEVRQGVPPILDSVLEQALQKQPEQRTATARELGIALDQIRTGDKVTLKQGSRWPSELPPARAHMRNQRAPISSFEGTVKMHAPEDDNDRKDDAGARAKTTFKSPGTPAVAAVATDATMPQGQTRALVAVAVAAIAGTAILLAWPGDEIAHAPANTKVPPTGPAASSASSPTLPAVDASAPSTVPSTPSAAVLASVPSTTVSAAPMAASATPPSAGSSPPRPPAVSSGRPNPKPKDYADVDEFPD